MVAHASRKVQTKKEAMPPSKILFLLPAAPWQIEIPQTRHPYREYQTENA
jgi:hypothetical protein